MSMDSNKLCFYRYIIDDIDVIYSDGKKDKILAMNVGSIFIEKDYDNCYMPIFNVNCTVTLEMYKKIAADKKARVRVRLNRFAVKVDAEYVDDKPKYVEPVLDDVFYIVNDNSDLDVHSNIQQESNVVKDGNTDQKTNFNTELNLFLFKEEALNINADIDSFILADTDPMTAIVYMAELCKVKRILISRPDNDNKQGQIIMPQTEFVTMVKNIENIYGVYNTSSVLFYDFDLLYYITKDIMKNQARLTGEITMVNINYDEFGSDMDRRPGSYLDKANSRYFINSPNYPTFKDMGSLTQEAGFNNISYVNTVTGDTNSKKIDLNGRSVNRQTVIDNKYNNIYIINSMAYDMKENNYVLSLSLQEIDMSYFTPNKRYSLQFNIKDFQRAQKFNGNYRLSKVVHSLSKNGSDTQMQIKTNCILKRPK